MADGGGSRFLGVFRLSSLVAITLLSRSRGSRKEKKCITFKLGSWNSNRDRHRHLLFFFSPMLRARCLLVLFGDWCLLSLDISNPCPSWERFLRFRLGFNCSMSMHGWVVFNVFPVCVCVFWDVFEFIFGCIPCCMLMTS